VTVATTELQAEAEQAGRDLEGASATEILTWALDRFHPGLAIAASMGDAVVISLAASIRPDVPVVFLDTGYHFAETIGTADAVEAVYPVKLLRITPKQTVADQDAEFGPKLHDRDPDLCCAMRKVEPLERALAPFQAWATGLRRSETESRANTPVVEWDDKRQMVKVNPIAAWSEEDVERYIAENGVLVNPLVAEGYPSIGCAPCTRRVALGDDTRAGRWAGTVKAECGLHL
jgi:phosphoadenosine phosphosulfate reductase